MSCFHPKTLNVFVDLDGKYFYHYSPVDYDPNRIQLSDQYIGCLPVPCRQCIGCRIDYSKSWRNRMLLESKYHDHNWFFTLTYDDAHLPLSSKGKPTCRIKDLQGFWKRLRYYFPDCNIMYYASSEYGENTHRPHYHAIIFGLDIPEGVCVPYKYTREGNLLYKSDFLSSIWQNGFVVVAPAMAKNMAYVARYTSKKLSSGLDFDGEDNDLEKPRSVCSLKPGIGLRYYLDHPDIVNYDKISVGMSDGCYTFPVPHYFFRKYFESLGDDAIMLKQKGVDDGINYMHLKFSRTDLSPREYFINEERKFRNNVYSVLKRDDLD